jgi:AbrB family looped-hinge helix DNA binding protein
MISYHFSMKTTVSERGQVTIPKRLRERLGIRPGQILEVVEEHGRVVMTKRIAEDAWSRVVGILNSGLTTDEMIEEMRGPVDACD